MTDPINRNEVGIKQRIPLVDGQTQTLIKILQKSESEKESAVTFKNNIILATYKAAEEKVQKKFKTEPFCILQESYVRLLRQSSSGWGAVQLVAHHLDCAVGGHGEPPGRWRRMIRRVRMAAPTQPPSLRHGLHSPHWDTRQSRSPAYKMKGVNNLLS